MLYIAYIEGLGLRLWLDWNWFWC